MYETGWVLILKRLFPDVLILPMTSVVWSRLDAVLLVGVSAIALKDGLTPLDGASVYIFDSPIRRHDSWEQWDFKSYSTQHNLVGGVSDAICKFTLAIHNDSRSSFNLSGVTIPSYPRSTVGGLLSCTVSGSELPSKPRLQPLDVPSVVYYAKGTLHPGGLLPWKRFSSYVIAKCVFAKTKFVKRKLQATELLQCCDIPITLHSQMQGQDVMRILTAVKTPLKCYTAIAGSIFINANFSSNGGGDWKYLHKVLILLLRPLTRRERIHLTNREIQIMKYYPRAGLRI